MSEIIKLSLYPSTLPYWLRIHSIDPVTTQSVTIRTSNPKKHARRASHHQDLLFFALPLVGFSSSSPSFSSSSYVFRFPAPATLDDFLVPSVLSLAFALGAAAFFGSADFAAPLAPVLAPVFFAPVLALGFCALGGASSSASSSSASLFSFSSWASSFFSFSLSSSSAGSSSSAFSVSSSFSSFSSAFFLPLDFCCGAPFFGSFLLPASFS